MQLRPRRSEAECAGAYPFLDNRCHLDQIVRCCWLIAGTAFAHDVGAH